MLKHSNRFILFLVMITVSKCGIDHSSWLPKLIINQLTDVNPYTLENVRIRYAASNNAVRLLHKDLDLRLNGEFVPGTESWLSFGYLKTEENIDNRGDIARPTDQRLKFGILFQDYMPNIPKCKSVFEFGL
jgi:hypothetical protein